MINFPKFFLVLSSVVILSACDTTPSQPQVQLTPLQACLKDLRWEQSICELGAMGTVKGGVPDSYYRCGDRRRMQEDRCYARHK